MNVVVKKEPVGVEGQLTRMVRISISAGKSTEYLAWVILGGKKFMSKAPTSALDFLETGQGVNKDAVMNLAEIMDIPMTEMARMLNLSYKTLGRKAGEETFDPLLSSLSIELAQTIAKGISTFGDTSKFNRWIRKENRGLRGNKPLELFSTPTGIKAVNTVLNRLEEGIYT